MEVRPGITRRQVLAGIAATAVSGVAGRIVGAEPSAASSNAAPRRSPGTSAPPRAAQTITGKLSGRKISIPDVNQPPMPALAPPGVIYNGNKAETIEIEPARGHPDVRSFRRKFGLIIPATNTSMEHELWSIIGANAEALRGVGLHTTNVMTPKPKLRKRASHRARAGLGKGEGDCRTAGDEAEPAGRGRAMRHKHELDVDGREAGAGH